MRSIWRWPPSPAHGKVWGLGRGPREARPWGVERVATGGDELPRGESDPGPASGGLGFQVRSAPGRVRSGPGGVPAPAGSLGRRRRLKVWGLGRGPREARPWGVERPATGGDDAARSPEGESDPGPASGGLGSRSDQRQAGSGAGLGACQLQQGRSVGGGVSRSGALVADRVKRDLGVLSAPRQAGMTRRAPIGESDPGPASGGLGFQVRSAPGRVRSGPGGVPAPAGSLGRRRRLAGRASSTESGWRGGTARQRPPPTCPESLLGEKPGRGPHPSRGASIRGPFAPRGVSSTPWSVAQKASRRPSDERGTPSTSTRSTPGKRSSMPSVSGATSQQAVGRPTVSTGWGPEKDRVEP